MEMRKWKRQFFRLGLLLLLVATTGLLTACGNGDNSGGGNDSPNSPSITQGESLPQGKPFFEGVYAGRVDDSDAFIAIVANDDTLKAYICDDAEISEWFTGENTERALTFINGNEVILSLNKNGDNEIIGSVLLGDGVIRGFVAGLSENHLLVRGQNNNHSEFTAVAGWIKLDDGAQRGTIRFNPRIKRKIPVKAFVRTQKAPRLKIVKNKPVLTGIRAKMKEQAVTALNLPFPPVVNFPSTNPVQPEKLGTPTPNGLKFVWTTVGDSYAAGEGNPILDAVLFPFTYEVVTPAVWGLTQNLPPGVSLRDLNACHRSDEAGAPKANRELVNRFPDVTFEFASFACSGAEIPDLKFNTRFKGPDRFVTDQPQSAQLVKASEFAARYDEYDAVYMNIGGNDAGFGALLEHCILPDPNPFHFTCDTKLNLDIVPTERDETKKVSPLKAIESLDIKYKGLDTFIA